MGVRAVFVGVDRFADPTIRDLTGCRSDAIALHALFNDAIQELASTLLVDENATGARVRAAFRSTLADAEPEDVAVVSFSGHGSPDHRLVVHDALKADLPGTAIEMVELAALFKSCRARVVLCLLDCCFSGGAPARVLDDVPLVRSLGDPLHEIAGEGRLIMAASGTDEPALELGGHGLFTKALIDALLEPERSENILAIMDAVMARVRAEAARVGSIQTPVLLGHVIGGMTLPPFHKGTNWSAAFPADVRHRFTGKVEELAAAGLAPELLRSWKEQFSDGLNELQLAAVNDYGILDGESVLVVAPTSSGKTFVGELAAARAMSSRRRSVFLFPYKALTNEKCDQFSSRYGPLGLRVVRCTSDSHDEVDEFLRGKYDLALFTFEMFLSVALGAPWTLQSLGLVVVDEAQFLADPRRGIVVELLLTLLVRGRARGIAPQLVALSAVIGDVNGFDAWLAARALVMTNRPVPLIEGVLDRSGRYRFRDSNGDVKDEQLLDRREIRQRGQKPSAQDVVVPLVAKLLNARTDERIIIFRNARGLTEGCAAYLARDLGLSGMDLSEQLPGDDPSSSSRALRDCLRGGTAFHNANLGPRERLAVERAFRDRSGSLRVLAATTTVAAGINTPASTVILAEQQFLGEDGREFTVAEYKNMAGRAGRLGFNERGRAIILADDEVSPEFLLRKYVLAEPEPLRSSFVPAALETWILRLLAQVTAIRRDEVTSLLASTYGGYLASRSDPKWQQRTQEHLEELLTEMLELGILEEERGIVQLTLLGRVCGRSSLSFSSAMRVVRLLRSAGTIDAEHLLVLIQALPESDASYTPLAKGGSVEDRWPREVAHHYGREAAIALQTQSDTNVYRARCKRAMVLRDWIEGVPMEAIERNASANAYQGKIAAGHVRSFADTARYHLRAAFEIANVVLVERSPTGEEGDAILYRLEFGLPAVAERWVRSSPVALGRGEVMALVRAGVSSMSELWAMPHPQLSAVIGTERVGDFEGYRPRDTAS